MGQSFNILENIAPLVKASSTTITMASTYLGKPTKITVGGQMYKASGTITLNTAAANGINALDAGALAANTLYYIYAVQSSGVLGIVASTSTPGTGPAGFGAWKEIGRFRTNFASAVISIVVNRLIGSNDKSQSSGSWIAYTPIFGAFTVSASSFFYRMIGETIHVLGSAQLNSAVSTTMTISLPTDLTFGTQPNETGSNSNTGGFLEGEIIARRSTRYTAVPYRNDTTSIQIVTSDNNIAVSGTAWNATVPATWASGDRLERVEFVARIAEFVGLFDD